LAPLCAAVANAGALGVLTAVTQPTPELLRQEIRKTRELTKKPFGVNISFLPAATPPDYEAYIKVILEEGIKVIETAGNNPGKYIKMLKDGGCVVIHKCVTVRHARTAVRYGADMISMDGFECAGHPGSADVGGFVLFAIACRELGVPFIASGGVGTGIQVAAAFALGADGVNCGTRFMATVEAPIHINIKQALIDADHTQTTLILRSLNNTERVFKNDMAAKAQAAENEKPGDFGVIRKYIAGSKYKISFQETGNTQDSVWSCGQVMGLIKDIPTVQQLVDDLLYEAKSTIDSRLPSLLVENSRL
jgi:NAD(P)H-dependent flavin oxidoreductase YrpB (nitropropane dioxygenase family)